MGLRTPRVLIVDDEPKMIAAIMRVLRRKQGQWDLVATTDSGLAYAIVGAGELDLLVTDIRMPHPDGNQLILAARRLERRIPIIVATAGGLSNAVLPLVDQILHKPFLPKQLEAAITILLSALEAPILSPAA